MIYAGKVAYAYKGEMPPNTHITLREDTIGIAGGAFCGKKNLVGITIPEGCKSIGNIAFFDCENLSEISIPDSIDYIEQLAFDNTAWLNNQPNGVVYAGKVAYCYKGAIPSDGHIALREDTISITDEAFAYAEELHRLKRVTMSKSVSYTGKDGYVTNSVPAEEGGMITYLFEDAVKERFV